jgi:GntR family transcriptional regulator
MIKNHDLLLPQIDLSNGGPLYEQVINYLKELIFSGVLQANSPMPSIRSLAEELSCSVITVKRAYEELKREGLIRTRSGKGTYVLKLNVEEFQQRRYSYLKENLLRAINLALQYQISVDEIQCLFHDCLEYNIAEAEFSK